MKIDKDKIANGVIHLIMIILLFLMLYPLAMTIWGAVKNNPDFAATKWYPTIPIYLNNIVVAFSQLKTYLGNTILVACSGTLGMLFISSLASFAFARMEFPGKNFFFMMVISLMMIPGVLTLVPSYMIYKSLIGLNNYFILILPIIFGGSVFGVFLLRSFFAGIPEEIFEAARVDGATEFVSYYKICLPLSLPILGTLAIMQVTGTWNDYMWPMITIKDSQLFTISPALLITFVGAYSTNDTLLFAGYLVASIPLILLFAFANKYYVEGLTSSAMKM